MADRDHSILLRLQSEGRAVPNVDLPEAAAAGELSVKEVSLRESGRFQVLGEIAAGGVGQVLKGRDTDLGRDVALKVIHERHLGTEHVLQRFVEEAQIGGQLQHPGIVPVYELGLQADKRPFFAMKLVKGNTLAKMLADRSDVSDDRRSFLSVFEEVCQTVGYAHSRGVIHRDIKPANIMVGAFGEVQVLDWGFAKVLPRGGVADERASRMKAPQVTEIATVRSLGEGSESIPGSVMGTLAYMPPEQALGQVEQLDERSDVFSLGAVLTEILTGQPPYTGEGKDRLIQAAQCRLDDAHARLDACGAEETLVDLARRCLSPESKGRPRNAAALAEVVHAHLARAEERARSSALAAAESRAEAKRAVQEAKDQRRVRRLGMTLAATVLLLLVAGGGGWVWQEKGKRARAERARTAVTTALAEAHRLRGEERWPEALRTATRAEEFAAAPEVDAETRSRAAALLVTVKKEEAEARAVEEQAARDEAFLVELEEIRLGAFSFTPDKERVDRTYREAFARYGLDLEAGGPAAPAAKIRSRGESFAREVAAALDEWAWSIRGRIVFASPLTGHVAPEEQGIARTRLGAIAAACTRDPGLSRLRDIIEEEDDERLIAFASDAAAMELPPGALARLGRALHLAGKREEAVTLLEGAARLHPGDPFVHLALASSLSLTDRRDEALTHYTAVLAILPESPGAWTNLAACHNRAEDFGRAESLAKRALEYDPAYYPAHSILASAYRSQGRPDEAIAVGRDAVRLNPSNAFAHTNLGTALSASGRRAEAIASFREAARLDPDLVVAWWNLAALSFSWGDLDEAIEAYRAFTRLAPTWTIAWIRLGIALDRKGRPDEAIEAHREALKVDPDSADAQCNIGHVHAREGRFEKALAAVRKGHELGLRLGERWRYPSGEWVEQYERYVEIAARLPAILSGDDLPMDAEERVAFAEVAARRGYLAAATRFYVVAFAEDPDLEALHAYHAASAAARSGAGLGEDGGDLAEAERTIHRRRALEWCRGRFDAQIEKLAANQRGPMFTTWLRDPSFACVRDEAAIQRLPADEREGWRRLWTEMRTALREAAAGK